ncbi:glycosyl hydrolase family 18 protein [Lederbergia citrea]|uniref:Glycoside hydrolase family 18 protein n=1 Tax=Lederbergia citrea TaxID=2833581 RepID=A0A942Z732_9BACI|nr:glycoside hydrolase family 18 protein [Lederbergia citrea]MBS4179768.1 glycoside hydrolase family 18 protein [Lederbergia citrea]MBS4206455.1 glycoside hydrolase family 18 protein [Lederbergia citrea]MBS4225075.1 glycoside hydrolase family 18 protein [Lederbergia citrea]
MQIHIVQPNQTLTSIAARYGVTPAVITDANELPNPDRLVVGQAIVIPIVGSFYFVEAGDSLFSIGRKFGIPYQELARINNIQVNQPLRVGMRLYIPQRQKSNREFNAYVEPFGTTVSAALETSARKAAPYLTYLSPFAYHAKRDGSLSALPLNNFPDIARANNNVLVMAIANQEEGQFSTELGHILLTNNQVQNTFLTNIMNEAKRIGFRDIHFDIERLSASDREPYNNFLRKARDLFHKEGIMISTALAPRTSAEQTGEWVAGHDYSAIGAIVDYVVIMTYEWGYSGGPAMAVSPIGPVRQVLEYTKTVIPANKIMMGQNLYGYDWTLPFVQGTTAKAVSPQRAIEIAADNNVAIQYDEKSQAPFFNYTASDGKRHEVWFEDARSIQAKFDLVKELQLRGVSYWKLGLSFPQNWLLITDNFHVVKK